MTGHVPRVYLDETISAGQTLTLARERAHHLGTVLRRRAGDALLLFNGDGREYRARIEHLDRKSLRLTVEQALLPARESALSITLIQGLAQGDRMDYAIAKAVELGVQRIQPAETRGVKNRLKGERLEKKLGHWRRVAISAAEQAGRLIVPPIEPPLALADCLAAVSPDDGLGLVLDPASPTGLSGLSPATRVTLIIGPEAGLTDAEISLAREGGFKAVSLGPRVLRTETAGPAALAALQTLWGDLG
ncbi:MAG: 16S rRNA (uracil(1498)-N(3))-methyltransferase [Salinisphaeraceae bacterium]|nr:16S rRNA (uracil(1498)-N(3))-methyltransferase [Salinisphaeraceae bacterium]